jgi:hypothetical protein
MSESQSAQDRDTRSCRRCATAPHALRFTPHMQDDSLHNLAIAEMYTRSCGDLTMPPLFDFSCQHKKENEKMKESYYELA